MIVVCGLKGNGRLTSEVRKSVILHHTPETRILRNLGLQLAELTLDRSDFKGSSDTQEIVQVCNTAGDPNR